MSNAILQPLSERRLNALPCSVLSLCVHQRARGRHKLAVRVQLVAPVLVSQQRSPFSELQLRCQACSVLAPIGYSCRSVSTCAPAAFSPCILVSTQVVRHIKTVPSGFLLDDRASPYVVSDVKRCPFVSMRRTAYVYVSA